MLTFNKKKIPNFNNKFLIINLWYKKTCQQQNYLLTTTAVTSATSATSAASGSDGKKLPNNDKKIESTPPPPPPGITTTTSIKEDQSSTIDRLRNATKNAKILLNKTKKYDELISQAQTISKTKLHGLVNLYEELSHMNEVRMAQNKVICIQDDLKMAQERRRQSIHELTGIRKKLQLLHADLMNCDKFDPRYLGLIRAEHELIIDEKQKLEIFRVDDDQERSLFNYLTVAVKQSHDKEKIYTETVKYWSICGSIIGALLGVIATIISYRYRLNAMKLLMLEYTKPIENMEKSVDKLTNETALMNRKMSELNETILWKHQQIDKKLMIMAAAAANDKQQQQQSWNQYFGTKLYGIYRWLWPTTTTTKQQQQQQFKSNPRL